MKIDPAVKLALEAERLKRARRRAERTMRRHPEDDGTFPPYAGPPKSARNLNGCAAQEAVAQFLGVRKCPAGVRPRWAGAPVLHVQEGRYPDSTICVLVTGRADGDLRLCGWIRASAAPWLGQRREDGRRRAWAIPADRLRPMSELRDAIESRRDGRSNVVDRAS